MIAVEKSDTGEGDTLLPEPRDGLSCKWRGVVLVDDRGVGLVGLMGRRYEIG